MNPFLGIGLVFYALANVSGMRCLQLMFKLERTEAFVIATVINTLIVVFFHLSMAIGAR